MSTPLVLNLGSGDHVHADVKAGVPTIVNFTVSRNKPGRGQWAFSGGTFDAPLNVYATYQLDGLPVSMLKPANGARVTLKPISGGAHVMTIITDKDVDDLGFVVDLGVSA